MFSIQGDTHPEFIWVTVSKKNPVLYERKNIYFEFQSRITCATGLGVTVPLLRRNSRRGINVMGSLTHKKLCVPQKLLFPAGSFFSVYPTQWWNIPKDAQALWFNVTIITCVCPCHVHDGWACLDKSPALYHMCYTYVHAFLSWWWLSQLRQEAYFTSRVCYTPVCAFLSWWWLSRLRQEPRFTLPLLLQGSQVASGAPANSEPSAMAAG